MKTLQSENRATDSRVSKFLLGLLSLTMLSMPIFALGQGAEPISRAEFDSWMQEISNWGRWGDEDELGTLNLITNQKRAQAAGDDAYVHFPQTFTVQGIDVDTIDAGIVFIYM